MIRPAGASGIQVGRDALARGAWEEAKSAFEGALARGESPEALEGLGLSAWWLDRGETVFDSRERAYALYRERGERAAAARVAVWLAWDYAAFRGESDVASGWPRRARDRLLGRGPCPSRARRSPRALPAFLRALSAGESVPVSDRGPVIRRRSQQGRLEAPLLSWRLAKRRPPRVPGRTTET